MPDDGRTVDITLPVEPGAALLLDDAVTRAIFGQIVSQMVQSASITRLFKLMDVISADARELGLTHEILEAELEAYNAEGRTGN